MSDEEEPVSINKQSGSSTSTGCETREPREPVRSRASRSSWRVKLNAHV